MDILHGGKAGICEGCPITTHQGTSRCSLLDAGEQRIRSAIHSFNLVYLLASCLLAAGLVATYFELLKDRSHGPETPDRWRLNHELRKYFYKDQLGRDLTREEIYDIARTIQIELGATEDDLQRLEQEAKRSDPEKLRDSGLAPKDGSVPKYPGW